MCFGNKILAYIDDHVEKEFSKKRPNLNILQGRTNIYLLNYLRSGLEHHGRSRHLFDVKLERNINSLSRHKCK